MKHDLVMTIMPDSALCVDIRKGKNTIGRLILTQTGVCWGKRGTAAKNASPKIAWEDIKKKFEA